VLDRIGLLQIDSVNVVARAHYMPVYSRLGPYPPGMVDRYAYRERKLFEYWAHEASLVPVALQPLLRWRMERARQGQATWGSIARIARERPDYVAWILRQVSERGPLRAGDLQSGGDSRRGPWWDRSDAKVALEVLFWTGDLAIADRVNFERRYDLTERVLPAEVLDAPTVGEEEAHRLLLLRSARAHGVGTARDLADYFRINIRRARERLPELVEQGCLQQVSVQGWREPAYLHSEAQLPRWVRARCVLSPFDPVVWERSRVQRLFGFRYRIEIYVPAAQRRHGYYVLPFLLGDRLVARVDLKADRTAGVLRALGSYGEEGIDTVAVAGELAAELARFSGWLGLGGVTVADRGDLGPALRDATP
nr:winged helix-turn-helix domain-containing protein [Euzebyales bacterium]